MSHVSPVPLSAPALVGTASVLALLTGCTGTSGPAAGGAAIEVSASDTACELSKTEAPAGSITFNVTNKGTKSTEFYLYGAGDRIVGEVENIGPGLSRKLSVEVADGGTYTTACKPGMVGDGIRAPFTVTGQAARSTDTNAQLAAAVAGYKHYVDEQVEQLIPKTEEFANAIKAGKVAEAKAMYPVAREPWERIEPVAESFGDMDPKIDGREDDEREAGEQFTGYHRLEKDLWVDGLRPDSGAMADRLVADVKELQNRVRTVELTPVQLANGAKELLDEVATTKITGEEDRYSHTDLWDFQANVEGSEAAVAALRPVIDRKDPDLGPVLDQRFEAVEDLLKGYRSGEGFKLYTELSKDDTRKMAEAVDALGEPVSKVSGLVTEP